MHYFVYFDRYLIILTFENHPRQLLSKLEGVIFLTFENHPRQLFSKLAGVIFLTFENHPPKITPGKSPPPTLTKVESTFAKVGGGDFSGGDFCSKITLEKSPPPTLTKVDSTFAKVGGGDFSGVILAQKSPLKNHPREITPQKITPKFIHIL